MTPGSWWKNTKTGQRLIVPRFLRAYLPESHWVHGHSSARHGTGRPVGLFPLLAEGESLYMRWLTLEELRVHHRPYRPPRSGRVPLPPWVSKADCNDFLLDGEFHCAVYGWRGSLVVVGGIDPVEQAFHDWGTPRYTLKFIESKDVIKRLTPKYNKLRSTAWDRIMSPEDP